MAARGARPTGASARFGDPPPAVPPLDAARRGRRGVAGWGGEKPLYDGSGESLPVSASFWKSEEGHLVCQWSQAVKPGPYHPSWMREAGQVKPTGAVPAFLDFTRLSPLGGLRRSYDPGTGGFLRQFGNRENSG